MAITRLSGGSTPADGSDPRTFPAIWNPTADVIEANESDIAALQALVGDNNLNDLNDVAITAPADDEFLVYDNGDWVNKSLQTAQLPAGSIVGTAYALKTDAQTFASVVAGASNTITDLTLSYSLANSSNKLLLFANVSGQTGSSHSQGITISANGTPIQIGDAALSRSRVTYSSTGDGNYHPTTAGVIEYAPGTTSSVTYTVQIVSTQSSTQTVFVNRSEVDENSARGYRTTSSFLIMEVAG